MAALLLIGTRMQVSAQWSEDPAVNNRITPSNLGFYDPCCLTNADGVTYYFYIVPNIIDGIDHMQMRLQIYDAEGHRQYGATGKVICNERNITWTKFNQYTTLDADGNLILMAYDLRLSAADRYDFTFSIYKISPKGELLWDEPVILNGRRGDVNCTGLSMCATDDGGTALAYSATSADGTHLVTHLERLDADGQLLWPEPVVVEPENSTNRPFVVNNGKNEVMVVYADSEVQFNARVFDAEGNDVWQESVPVYSGGYSDGIHVYPSVNVQEGPDGGVIFSVMDSGYEGRVVCLDRDGQYVFPTANYGTKVAGPDYQSTVPAVYFDPAEKAFFVAFANMALYGSNGYGVNVQKFSYSGQRLWGDDGIVIDETRTGQQTAAPYVRPAADGRIAVFYEKQAGTIYGSPVGSYISLIDKDGRIVKEPQNFTTTLNIKNDFTVSPLIGGNHYIASWTEKRANSTSACIYSQYVNVDGNTSGIDHCPLTIDHSPLTIDHCFDLQGRAIKNVQCSMVNVQSKNGQCSMVYGQLKKGLYIVDGKKVVKP